MTHDIPHLRLYVPKANHTFAQINPREKPLPNFMEVTACRSYSII